jgi:hypothetical protein
VTTAGLLDTSPPLSDLRPQAQPSKTDRPAFAQHLEDAEAGMPAVREERPTQSRSRATARPAEAKSNKKREPGMPGRATPVVIPAATDEPRPLELHLDQSNQDGSAEQPSAGLTAAVLTTALPDVQADPAEAMAAQHPGDLAFAAKVGPEASATVAPKAGVQQPSPAADSESPLVDALSAASSHEVGKTEGDHEQPETAPVTAGNPPPALTQNSVLDAAAKPTTDAASAAPRVEDTSSPTSSQVVQLNPVDHQPQKAVSPLSDIRVQLGGGAQERVDVRLVDRSGELHVAVRATSDNLTKDLREGLSELVGRLESTGYRTEVWRPGAVSAVASAAETNQSNDRNDREPQAQTSWNQDSDKREQQNQQKPRWVEELEDSAPSGSQRLSGGLHGFIR